MRTHVHFSRVIKIEPLYEVLRVNDKVERSSTFTFMRDLAFIASILLTHVKIRRRWKSTLRLVREASSSTTCKMMFVRQLARIAKAITHPFCPSLTTLSSSPSLVLIHFTPCNCGSIINGHRSQLVSIVAFSVLMRSLGRFSLFHWAIVALSVNKVRGSRPSVILMGT